MKNKQLLFLALMGLSFCFACKKNQVCSCNVNAMSYSENLTYTFKETKNNAKEACATYEKNAEASYTNSGLTGVTVDCTLK
jgi:hypothetical protein